MSKLDSLFDKLDFNPLCKGCSILEKNKPFHAKLDYEDSSEADILLLSDSYRLRYGKSKIFTNDELNVIIGVLESLKVKDSIELATAIKCPQVKKMSAKDTKICRAHYNNTIEKIKPKLVYAFGADALYMATGLKGFGKKRGRLYDGELESGYKYKIAPAFHPFQVIKEPKNKYLFHQDIRNAYESVFKPSSVKPFTDYEFAQDIETLEKYSWLRTYEGPIGCDVETSGLNFLKDKLYTIAFSAEGKTTLCVALDHPENPIPFDVALEFIRAVLINPLSAKVFQNTTFDLKFLTNYSIPVVNTDDTKLMSKMSDENTPNGLMDLMRTYFPREIEC